jgi:hypothetical protein
MKNSTKFYKNNHLLSFLYCGSVNATVKLEGGRYYIGFTKRLRRGFESTVPQRKALFGIIPNYMPVTFVMGICIRYRKSNLYIVAKRPRGLEWCFIFLFNVYGN